MPGVVLHVVGGSVDPGPILAGASLRPYASFRRGDKLFPNSPRIDRRHEVGGFKCEVSSSDGDFAEEVRDAIAFLRQHYEDLSRLEGVPEIDAKGLDFGYYLRLDDE